MRGRKEKSTMSMPLSFLMKRRKTDHSAPLTEYVAPGNRPWDAQILDQDLFLRMLYLERKRTERSGRRFVLMLLEAGRLLKIESDQEALHKVLLALTQATRETDIKGWYKDGSIIGVIFTEIDPTQGKAVANALLPRVSGALASTLGIEDINEIRLSFHVFPEDATSTNGHGNGSDPMLYPDLAPNVEGKKISRIIKRSMDIAVSLAVLLLISPLLLAIAIAVKLTSRGPILFRQHRAGQYGRKFTFLKFRSMRTACDQTVHQEYMKSFIADQAAGEPAASSSPEPLVCYKMKADARVTLIGRLIRRTSLDELPQLFNVLTGDMSLVGPRPAILYEVACYDPWHRQRLLAVKPGITGLWQVGGRSRVKFSDMVRLDLQYARSWSLWLDIKILLRTPRAVISGEGAY
jgi:lipopolysaccharide/colanic/teichoic acid biosynthesis glycosyltransferase